MPSTVGRTVLPLWASALAPTSTKGGPVFLLVTLISSVGRSGCPWRNASLEPFDALAYPHIQSHNEGEFFELFLHGLERAGGGFNPPGDTARGVVGDAVSTHVEERADEFCCLPGVQAGLHEFLAQGGEIGGGELFDCASCG